MSLIDRFAISALFLALVAGVGSAFASEEVSPEAIDGATTVDGAKAKALFDEGALFVDTRKDSDWEAGRIPGALHLELKKVYSKEALLEEAAADEPIVLYCNGPRCLRSSKASVLAVGWGFEQVYYYREGFPDWKGNGNPVE